MFFCPRSWVKVRNLAHSPLVKASPEGISSQTQTLFLPGPGASHLQPTAPREIRLGASFLVFGVLDLFL